MNRISLLFAALLAASFAVAPGHAPEAPPAMQRGAGSAVLQGKAGSAKAGGTANNQKSDKSPVRDQAVQFVSGFLTAGGKAPKAVPGYHVLFVTVADPVETHLAAAFDHDVAAVQDAVQDSGYLFDSSWIPWSAPQSYDSYDDEQSAEQARREKHAYPGILLFRSAIAPNASPYAQGLIVFILAEKPTTGINITQAKNALAVMAAAMQGTAAKPSALPAPVLLAGPSYSGSFNSLALLVGAFRNADGIEPPQHFLIRSGGFTSSREAAATAEGIARQFHVDVDMGSAFHPFEWWSELTLQTLEKSGIERKNIAVLSEGESLFGQSVETEVKTKDKPWSLQFPRDISALRSSYEKQGLLEGPSNPDASKRALRLNPEDAHNGDSIRMFGTDATVAAQESVLFGISEFIRSHGIHAVMVVATNEEDSYFLTRFVHSNNPGVRIVVVDATRLFMRGPTAQFRGDMMVTSFPLLPRLHDWTTMTPLSAGSKDAPQDPSYHLFPNDSSEGAFMAVRDLLWGTETSGLPHEYSLPDWNKGSTADLRPPVYIAALGGGASWPVAEMDAGTTILKDGTVPAEATAKGASPAAPSKKKRETNPAAQWRLSMPFVFGQHLGQDNAPVAHTAAIVIRASQFWQLTFWITLAIPVSYCIGIFYADPVHRRKFAYLQPAGHWAQWILLLTIPALLSEASFLVLARHMTFPAGCGGNHEAWMMRALWASILAPAAMIVLSWVGAYRAGCFSPTTELKHRRLSTVVFACTAVLGLAGLIAFNIWNGGRTFTLADVLHAYREMHWDSGLSLLPTVMLLILAMAVWNYEALVGISVLLTRPQLPECVEFEHIGEKKAEQIASAGHPVPVGKGTGAYWLGMAAAAVSIFVVVRVWPSFRAITSLSDIVTTHRVLALAGVAGFLMLMDLVQFVWLWSELHDLLQVLNAQPFKRNFLSLRNFNWSSIWAFSGGSFQERRKVLAAEVECAFEVLQLSPGALPKDDLKNMHELRDRYSKMNIDVSLGEYRKNLTFTHECLAKIGTEIGKKYRDMIAAAAGFCAPVLPTNDDPFRNEENELEKMPSWLNLYERFLCVLYLGFIRVIIARLRTLAISVVLLFSLTGLALAVYPFEPTQPLFILGAAALLAIAVVMFVVFSQMDKDPVLARILQSNPNKLEWSFYGKFLDTLALPVLTLLSTLLPGGAGRIIDLLRTAFSHAQ